MAMSSMLLPLRSVFCDVKPGSMGLSTRTTMTFVRSRWDSGRRIQLE